MRGGDGMRCGCPDGLGLTTAVNTLAVMLANCLNEEEVELAACLFTQLGDTLSTVITQRALCGNSSDIEEV